MSEYIAAYTSHENVKSQLKDSLGYYRTSKEDVNEINTRKITLLNIPILAIGGEYAMGEAVKEGLNRVGNNVSGIVSSGAGHYPVEQTPDFCSSTIVDFLKKQLDFETA